MSSFPPSPNDLPDASLPSTEALAHLQNLENRDWRVRHSAVKALGEIRDPKAVEPLIMALHDCTWNVRIAAAHALGAIGDLRAVEPLGIMYKREWFWFRQDVAFALHRIGGHKLPLRILSSKTLMPEQKINSLHGLIDVIVRTPGDGHGGLEYRYSIGNVQGYCEYLCQWPDVETSVKQGAEAVLAELRNRPDVKTLLRASASEPMPERQELLRGASGQPDATPPKELLHPSETSTEQTFHEKPGIWSRIFRRK